LSKNKKTTRRDIPEDDNLQRHDDWEFSG
jgi:hypothetical protein